MPVSSSRGIHPVAVLCSGVMDGWLAGRTTDNLGTLTFQPSDARSRFAASKRRHNSIFFGVSLFAERQ